MHLELSLYRCNVDVVSRAACAARTMIGALVQISCHSYPAADGWDGRRQVLESVVLCRRRYNNSWIVYPIADQKPENRASVWVLE